MTTNDERERQHERAREIIATTSDPVTLNAAITAFIRTMPTRR